MSMGTGWLFSYPQVLIEADEVGFETCAGCPLQQNLLMELCLFSDKHLSLLLWFQHAAPHIHMTNGKALQASASAIKTSTIPVIKRQRQNWLDASDDGFFIATEETR